jgi:hypothetical protein
MRDDPSRMTVLSLFRNYNIQYKPFTKKNRGHTGKIFFHTSSSKKGATGSVGYADYRDTDRRITAHGYLHCPVMTGSEHRQREPRDKPTCKIHDTPNKDIAL